MSAAVPPPDNTTLERDLASYIIPGNTLGPNGCLWFHMDYKGRENVATTNTLRMKLGGTLIFSYSFGFNWGNGSHAFMHGFIQNKNATGTQHIYASYVVMSGTYDAAGLTFNASVAGPDGTSTKQVSLDTTQDQTLLFTVQWAAVPGFDPSAELLAGYVELLK